MSLDAEESALFQLLQRLVNMPFHWSMNFSKDANEFLERLKLLEDTEGQLANKKLYRKIREIVKSGTINDKKEFVISTIFYNSENGGGLRRIFKDLPDKQIHVTFVFLALAELEMSRRTRIDTKWEEFSRSGQLQETFPQIAKSIEEASKRAAQNFSTNMNNIAEALERQPDNKQVWEILASILNKSVGKEYLEKAAKWVVNKNIECHIRTRRELAEILIEHRAPTAAEKVLDGASLNPFA